MYLIKNVDHISVHIIIKHTCTTVHKHIHTLNIITTLNESFISLLVCIISPFHYKLHRALNNKSS